MEQQLPETIELTAEEKLMILRNRGDIPYEEHRHQNIIDTFTEQKRIESKKYDEVMAELQVDFEDNRLRLLNKHNEKLTKIDQEMQRALFEAERN